MKTFSINAHEHEIQTIDEIKKEYNFESRSVAIRKAISLLHDILYLEEKESRQRLLELYRIKILKRKGIKHQ